MLQPLVPLLSAFPSLHTLHFPDNLLNQDEIDFLYHSVHPVDQRGGKGLHPTLLRVEQRETSAVSAMAAVAPRLKHVSWLRRSGSTAEERSVCYEIERTPDSDATGIHLTGRADNLGATTTVTFPTPPTSPAKLKYMVATLLLFTTMALGVLSSTQHSQVSAFSIATLFFSFGLFQFGECASCTTRL